MVCWRSIRVESKLVMTYLIALGGGGEVFMCMHYLMSRITGKTKINEFHLNLVI